MLLYHGTYDIYLENIFKQGFLRYSEVGEDTKQINHVLERFLKTNIRDKAIYLSNSIAGVNGYDYSLNIYTDDLDINSLFVGDNKIIQEMYDLIMSYPIKDIEKELKLLSKKYKESFISFTDYLNNQYEYESIHYPEFLYFKEIEIDMDEEDELYLKEISNF